ncbi:MAG: hypothetical protein ACTSQG_09350 [Promethearchaeota archaeon]
MSDKIKLSPSFLDDLVHKHVIFDNRYGSDEFLADLLIDLFNCILRKEFHFTGKVIIILPNYTF